MPELKHKITDVLEGTEVSADTLALSTRLEIDLQISTAKNYPRSIAQFMATTAEMVTYSRDAAESMFYKLPRAGKLIEGPSVRLAEIIGQNWGNCRVGARVLGNDDKTVTSQGVFHDLQTNVAISFEIKRRITRKDGTRYDEDMISVTGAAAAAIAFRNAVLKGVPKIYWAPLYEKALATARDDKDVKKRREAAIEEFQKMGVPLPALLKTLGVTAANKIGADELLLLRGIYNAIREGTTTPVEAFELGPKPLMQTTEIEDKLKASIDIANAQKDKPGREKKKPPKPAEPTKPPKANIPAPPRLDDPFLTITQQTVLFNTAVHSGWKIPEEVNQMLQKTYKLKSLGQVRNSQYAEILTKLKSGT